MTSVYTYERDDVEALTRHVEGSKISNDWLAYQQRQNGAIWKILFCPFCNLSIDHFEATRLYEKETVKPSLRHLDPPLPGFDPHDKILLVVCRNCGWYRSQTEMYPESPIFPIVVGSSAILEKKELVDPDLPLSDLRSHLIRNWGDRREITPSQAESLVADIFKGYLDGHIRYTTNGVY
jgi:hypothetical protein